MCGILSMSLFGKQGKRERKKRVNIARALFVETLRESQPRGRDATGILTVFEDDWYVLKQPVPSNDFVLGEDQNKDGKGECEKAALADMLGIWSKKPDKFKTALGHVRAMTQGDKYDNTNNHPIVITREDSNKCVIGIHNGVISNDDALFKTHNFDRIGRVDSEIIFQLLYEYTEEDGCIKAEGIKKAYEELRGSFAVLAVSMDEPEVMVGAVNAGRPCDVYFIPEIQACVFVSDDKYLKEAMKSYSRSLIRGEFDRKLTLEEYKKSLSGRVFAIDTRENVKSVDDMFTMVEDAPKVSYNYATTTHRGSWYYTNKYQTSSDTDKKKEDEKEDKTEISASTDKEDKEAPPPSTTKKEGDLCHVGYGYADPDNDWAEEDTSPGNMETEDNFEPAPPMKTVSDAKDETDSDGDGSEYTEVEVQMELDEAEMDNGKNDFAGGLTFEYLSGEGEDIIDRLIIGDSEEYYDDVREFLSLFNDDQYEQLIERTKEEEQEDNQTVGEAFYKKSFGEGFAVGFREGLTHEEDYGGADTHTNGMTPSQMEDEINALRAWNDKLQATQGRQSEALRQISSLVSAIIPRKKKNRVDIAKTQKLTDGKMTKVALIGALKLVGDIERVKQEEKEKQERKSKQKSKTN